MFAACRRGLGPVGQSRPPTSEEDPWLHASKVAGRAHRGMRHARLPLHQAAGPPPAPTSTTGASRSSWLPPGSARRRRSRSEAGSVRQRRNHARSSGVTVKGGVFVIKNGVATRLAGSPLFVVRARLAEWARCTSARHSAGPAARPGAAGTEQRSPSTRCSTRRPKKFTGFNGIGFGANGRLYAGVARRPDRRSRSRDHPLRVRHPVIQRGRQGPQGRRHGASGSRGRWRSLQGPRHRLSPTSGRTQPKKVGTKAQDFILRVQPGRQLRVPELQLGPAQGVQELRQAVQVLRAAHGRRWAGRSSARSALHLGVRIRSPAPPPKVVSMPLTGGARADRADSVAPVVGLATRTDGSTSATSWAECSASSRKQSSGVCVPRGRQRRPRGARRRLLDEHADRREARVGGAVQPRAGRVSSRR